MKETVRYTLTLILTISLTAINVLAKEYTSFNIVFAEKEGAKVIDTAIRIFASVNEDALVDRTSEFKMEDVKWYKYLPTPAEGKTAEDYDYVDEELKIYGMLVTDEDVFEHSKYSYFLRIARLYAQEEDSFHRNVKINGVDVDEMKGTCFNTGNEFFLKTITNGAVGPSPKGEIVRDTGKLTNVPGSLDNEGNEVRNKCKVCGICPIQPLGICLFIWLAAVVVILLVIVIKVNKKKNANK